MESVPWLDDDEQRAWRAFIAALAHYRREIEAPLLAETGLSSLDYSVLVYLSEAPKRQARMSVLAETAGVSSSQLVYRIDRLIELGYLERHRSPTDRRGTLAVLTDVGLAALEQAAQYHVRSVREAFVDRLTRNQLSTLAKLLDRAVRG